jgi:hypothetical protein
MIDKNLLDHHFDEILKKKEQALKDKFPQKYLNTINISQLIFIGEYLNEIKPKSKSRKYKEYLINYLNEFIYSNKELSRLEIQKVKDNHLESLISYLRDFHDFYTNFLIFYVYIILGGLVDLFLFIIGLAKYYYYIPLFALLFLFFAIRKYKKLKKEGKILYL